MPTRCWNSRRRGITTQEVAMQPQHTTSARPRGTTQFQPRPLTERFWERIDRSNNDGCWSWRGGKDASGYGTLVGGVLEGQSGKYLKAHRVSWELHYGPIPDGLFVLHRCDNPPCCNPKHLFLGTAGDNIRDAVAKGRTAKGERNGTRLHPERLARGDRNGTHLHPDRVLRGEGLPQSKLTDDQVVAIRQRFAQGGITKTDLAAMYGVDRGTILHIVTRKTWAHIP